MNILLKNTLYFMVTIFCIYIHEVYATDEVLLKKTNDINKYVSKEARNIVKISTPRKTKQKTAEIGIYITDIYNLNFSKNFFDTTFWIWIKHDGTHKTFKDKLDFVNSQKHSYYFFEDTPVEDYNYYVFTAKICTRIIKTWDMKLFPFDTHRLPIMIEGTDSLNISELSFSLDSKGSSFSKEFVKKNLPGWNSFVLELETKKANYDSTFGFPSINNSVTSSYPRFIGTMVIKRDWESEFFKSFGILYLAFLFSMLTFFLEKKGYSNRIRVNISAVGTLIINKIIMQNYLPPADGITLYLKIEYLTLLVVLITFISIIIYSAIIRRNNLMGTVVKWFAFGLSVFVYVFLNVYWLFQAHEIYLNT